MDSWNVELAFDQFHSCDKNKVCFAVVHGGNKQNLSPLQAIIEVIEYYVLCEHVHLHICFAEVVSSFVNFQFLNSRSFGFVLPTLAAFYFS